MKKQPQVRERTREKMFDAFFKEYKEKTLRGVTVGAVSRRANVNRSTFYEYFTDIYDLIDQAEDSLLTEMLSRIMQLQKEGFNEQRQQLMGYGEKIINEYGERLAILLGHGDTGFSQKMIAAMKPVTTEIFQIDITDPKAELLISFILSGITGYITVWYNNGKPVAIHDMVAALQSIMAYSVSILKNQ